MSEAPTETETRLVAEARQFVGSAPSERRAARDDVNVAMINHWADALDDRNPVYTDPEAAARTRHGGVIAPPAMLGTWTMDGNTGAANVWEPRPPAGEAPGATGAGPRDQVLRRLEQAGYTAVVATNYEQTYLRQLRPGDRLTETLTVEDLSERKDTALGTGYFVTVRHDYFDADEELIGVARMRLLKFAPPDRPRPAAEDAPPTAPRRPRPPINRDNAFFWEGVDAGELRIQRCAGCGTLRHPPRPMCGACQSTEFDIVVSSGRGTIYSYAVHHHPPLPGIELPLVVILVELEEGVRLVSSLTDASAEAVAIGLPVEVVFTRVDDGLTLPLFRLAERPAG